MPTVGRLTVRLTAATGDLERGLKKAERLLNRHSARAQAVGMRLSAGFSLPLAGAGAAALKFSTDLNRGMADVATLLSGSPQSVAARAQDLKAQIQALSIGVGKDTQDLAGGLYQVVSAFGDGVDTINRLTIAAKAATAGVATTTDAINLLSGVTKGYGDTSAAALRHTSDLAFMTVKLGQTTFPELAASMGRVIPTAKALGVSQEELFAGFAALTGVTGNAAEVSTQLSSILRANMKQTTGLTAAIDALGYSSSEAMIADLGLVGSLEALLTKTDGTAKGVAALFGRAEALTSAFALTGAQSDVFKEKLAQVMNASGATEAAFGAQTAGINALGFQFTQLKQTLAVIAQRFGDELAPVVQDFIGSTVKPAINVLGNLVARFGALDPSAKRTIVTIGGIALALGPALVALGMFGLALSGLPALLAMPLPMLRTLIKLPALAAVAYGKLGPAVAFLGGKLKLAWAAMSGGIAKVIPLLAAVPAPVWIIAGALAAGIAIWLKWGDEIAEAVSGVYNSVKKWIGEKLGSVFEWVGDQLKAVGAAFRGLWAKVVGFFGGAKAAAEDGVENEGSGIARFADQAKDKIKKLAGDAAGMLRGLLANARDAGQQLLATMGSLVGNPLGAIFGDLSGLTDDWLEGLSDGSAEAEAALAELEAALAAAGNQTGDLGDEGTETLDDLAQAARGWGDSLSDSIARATQEGKLSFRDFANSVIYDLARITARLGIVQPLMGSIGGWLGIPQLVPAETKHSGGTVGRGGSRRTVPLGLFAGAPRMHRGGIIGPDEVPIIARRGERVLTPGQAEAMSGGGRLEVVVRYESGRASVPVDVRHETAPTGGDRLVVLVRDVMRRLAADGSIDEPLAQRYGMRPQGARL